MKTIVITGATSGIGYEVAKLCLENNYRVIGIGRNQERSRSAVEKLSQINPNVYFLIANLAEKYEVLRVAQEIKDILDRDCDGELYGLINNVGCVKSWYATNQNGYELQFATNHLASFLLTHELLPYLIKAKGRILMTASKSHKMTKIRWHDLMFEKHYRPLMAYKQSKLCNLLFAYALNEGYSDQGIRAYGVDPGLVNTEIGGKETGALVKIVWNIRKKAGVTADVPAKTYLYLLNQEEHPRELYYYQSQPAKFSREVNSANAMRIMAISEALCEIEFGGGL